MKFQLDFTLSPEEHKEYLDACYKNRDAVAKASGRGNWKLWLIVCGFLGGICITLFAVKIISLPAWPENREAQTQYLLKYIMPIVMGVLIAVIFSLKSRYETRKALQPPTYPFHVEIDDNGIATRVPAGGTTLAWSQIKWFAETTNTLVLVSSGAIAIPKRAFASPEQCAEFSRFVADRVPKP